MLTIDLESFRDTLPDNYMQYKIGTISAPSNYKDPEKIEKYIADAKAEAMSKLALSPLTGRVILIGLMFDKDPSLTGQTSYYIGKKPVWYYPIQGDEKAILNTFWMIFSKYTLNEVDVVSFNGKAFDLPFIMNRTLINGLTMPRKISMQEYLNKYRHTPHMDVYNWFGSGSLVEWSYRLGLTDSLQRDGGQIGTWYETGQMQMIIDKNIIDVAQTSSIYLKIKDML